MYVYVSYSECCKYLKVKYLALSPKSRQLGELMDFLLLQMGGPHTSLSTQSAGIPPCCSNFPRRLPDFPFLLYEYVSSCNSLHSSTTLGPELGSLTYILAPFFPLKFHWSVDHLYWFALLCHLKEFLVWDGLHQGVLRIKYLEYLRLILFASVSKPSSVHLSMYCRWFLDAPCHPSGLL